MTGDENAAEMMAILDSLPDLRVPAGEMDGTPPVHSLNTAPPSEAGTLPFVPGLGPKQTRDLIDQVKSGGELLQEYRQIQGLQLTSLQVQILAAISPGKIREAPLRDLVAAFKTLKDKELVMDGKPTEIVGLAGYLQILEKEPNKVIDVTPGQVVDAEEIPEL